MDNVISDVTDEMGELARDTGKKFVKDVVKGVPKAAKQQLGSYKSDVSNTSDMSNKSDMSDKSDKSYKSNKFDPVTGKPVPSKKVLSDLQKATAQVAQMKLKQIREELEKQRLKPAASSEQLGASKQQGQGPEIPVEQEKPKEDVISKVLKASKSTGEMGRNIGG